MNRALGMLLVCLRPAVGFGILAVTNPAVAQQACEVAHLTASDGTPSDDFGWAVAVSGDTALVSAQNDNDNGGDSGSAYVFRLDGSTWVEEQKLLASDGQNSDHFGHSVSIHGDTAVVGATGHDHKGLPTGAAYVYRFDGRNWFQVQELGPEDAEDNGFGKSVSISGDVIVVGAFADDDNGSTSGSAYVFRFEGSTWIEEQKLLASDGNSGDFFGIEVAIDGDVAVIGAPNHDVPCPGNPTCKPGAVYVFRFDPKRSKWFEEQELIASDGAHSDEFGCAASISGNLILVGAFADDDNGNCSGSAYVFRYDPDLSSWVEEQKLLASDGQVVDQFGRSVAIEGDTALIGAWFHDDGAAYLYRFDAAMWVEEEDKLLPEPDGGPFFGWSVALSGDTAVVGAYGEDSQTGAAYVFAGVSGADCNGNGLSDACEILDGAVEDANDNGIPDECECPWDLDDSGDVGITDFLALLAAWGTDPGGPPDFDGDGDVGISDFLAMLANWGACP